MPKQGKKKSKKKSRAVVAGRAAAEEAHNERLSQRPPPPSKAEADRDSFFEREMAPGGMMAEMFGGMFRVSPVIGSLGQRMTPEAREYWEFRVTNHADKMGAAGGGWLLCSKCTLRINMGLEPDPACTAGTINRKNPLDGARAFTC